MNKNVLYMDLKLISSNKNINNILNNKINMWVLFN